MPKVTFQPQNVSLDIAENTKILVAGNRAKVPIRYGCASCRCGTCGVKITKGEETLSPMKQDEESLLKKIGLPTDGSKRLACRARVGSQDVEIDLDFQATYSPDDLIE